MVKTSHEGGTNHMNSEFSTADAPGGMALGDHPPCSRTNWSATSGCRWWIMLQSAQLAQYAGTLMRPSLRPNPPNDNDRRCCVSYFPKGLAWVNWQNLAQELPQSLVMRLSELRNAVNTVQQHQPCALHILQEEDAVKKDLLFSRN